MFLESERRKMHRNFSPLCWRAWPRRWGIRWRRQAASTATSHKRTRNSQFSTTYFPFNFAAEVNRVLYHGCMLCFFSSRLFNFKVTCSNCGRLSDTTEHTNLWPIDVKVNWNRVSWMSETFSLSNPLFQKYIQDVSKGMSYFLREEVLDGENAYKCDKFVVWIRHW